METRFEEWPRVANERLAGAEIEQPLCFADRSLGRRASVRSLAAVIVQIREAYAATMLRGAGLRFHAWMDPFTAVLMTHAVSPDRGRLAFDGPVRRIVDPTELALRLIVAVAECTFEVDLLEGVPVIRDAPWCEPVVVYGAELIEGHGPTPQGAQVRLIGPDRRMGEW